MLFCSTSQVKISSALRESTSLSQYTNHYNAKDNKRTHARTHTNRTRIYVWAFWNVWEKKKFHHIAYFHWNVFIIYSFLSQTTLCSSRSGCGAKQYFVGENDIFPNRIIALHEKWYVINRYMGQTISATYSFLRSSPNQLSIECDLFSIFYQGFTFNLLYVTDPKFTLLLQAWQRKKVKIRKRFRRR